MRELQFLSSAIQVFSSVTLHSAHTEREWSFSTLPPKQIILKSSTEHLVSVKNWRFVYIFYPSLIGWKFKLGAKLRSSVPFESTCLGHRQMLAKKNQPKKAFWAFFGKIWPKNCFFFGARFPLTILIYWHQRRLQRNFRASQSKMNVSKLYKGPLGRQRIESLRKERSSISKTAPPGPVPPKSAAVPSKTLNQKTLA